MEPVEYDVYISYRDSSGADLARIVSDGLQRRGFRVLPDRRSAGSEADRFRDAIENAPDFVLLLTPNCLDACSDERDAMRAEIAHALQAERNIVPVVVRGYEHPRTLPADIVRLRTRQPVQYNQARGNESIARIAHRLSSDATVDDRHVMRSARRIGTGVALLLLALAAVAAVQALPGMVRRYLDSRPLAPMTLSWSAFGQRLANGRWTELAVRDGSPMAAGDEFRVVFSTSADGYAYVLTRDVRGEISILFPGRALKNASRVRAGELHVAPADGGWWEFDQGAGPDRIYVVASYDPVENLESLADEREDSADARQSLLDSTIAGLLDGRHGSAGSRVYTRRGRLIRRSLAALPPLLTASATLGSGATIAHTLTREQGLLSAMAEIRVGPAR